MKNGDELIRELNEELRDRDEVIAELRRDLDFALAARTASDSLREELAQARQDLSNKHAELMKMSDWAYGIMQELKALKAAPHVRLVSRAKLARAALRGKLANSIVGDLVRHVADSRRFRTNMITFETIKASLAGCNGDLIVTFPIITWEFRWQRPQHIVSRLRDNGFSVLYLAMSLAPLNRRFRSSREAGAVLRFNGLASNVNQIWLHSRQQINVYTDPLVGDDLFNIVAGMQAILVELKPKSLRYLIQFPGWWPVAKALKEKFGGQVIFDCMDDHGGFSTNTAEALKMEQDLIEQADLVVTSSALLEDRCRLLNPNTIQVKNGTEFDHFANPRRNGALDQLAGKPIIGYYGAISDWFDMELVAYCARSRPQWNFVLVGATFGADLGSVAGLANVHLLGEKPYGELPGYLGYFDVCTIPFKIIPLTLATNPVKFYEYLSAGKPVVSVDLPELIAYSDHCYLARNPGEFLSQLEMALSERGDQEKIQRRQRLARDNSWDSRVKTLLGAPAFNT